MEKQIKGLNINYTTYGNKNGTPLVLLHGWGQNIEMMKPIGDPFQTTHFIIILDLPGFGESEEPPQVWTIYDYADLIHDLLHALNMSNPTLIGHSFGGKIGLAYASKYPVQKLVLFAAPYIREIKTLSFKTKILKSVKKLPGMEKLAEVAKKHIGSDDYRAASTNMRNILVEHVNLDLTEDVKKIKCPTLMIWGTNDTEASIERGKELETLIPDAGLVIYEGCTHYAYLERLQQTIQVLTVFLEG